MTSATQPESRSPREVLALVRQEDLQAIDLRFLDFPGTHKHITIPAASLEEASFTDGIAFDASSLRGWQAVHESDLLLVPQPETAAVDPLMERTLALLCHIKDPITRQDYPRDPRNIARKADAYLRSTGLAEQVQVAAEVEFFVFDRVEFDLARHEAYYRVESGEGEWSRGSAGHGYALRRREGYLPLPPADSLQQLRTEIMLALQGLGVAVRSQRHETASGGQCGLDLAPASLLTAADNLLRVKYLTRNVAARHGKTATFMPKPLWDDNGSGLHLGLSMWGGGEPLFAGGGYGGLSEDAFFALGGLLSHAASLAAFCCPTTNSYKRLIAGFDAPINLTYSLRNRSAAVRVPPPATNPEEARFEFRLPDPSCNPYLALAAVVMAMLDGLENRLDPGPALEKDIYDLEPRVLDELTPAPQSLEESLAALKADHEFLLRGDVFTEDVIGTWLEDKRSREVDQLRQRPHPWEFAMYFDS